MIQFQEIRIDTIYLTSDDTAAGHNYISEVTGLTPLKLTSSRIDSGTAIDGTPLQQFRSHKGRVIDVLIPLIPDAKYEALITAMNGVEALGNNHSVVFTGMKGTFSLTCVLDELDDSGQMLEAGHRDFRARFRIATVVSIT